MDLGTLVCDVHYSHAMGFRVHLNLPTGSFDLYVSIAHLCLASYTHCRVIQSAFAHQATELNTDDVHSIVMAWLPKPEPPVPNWIRAGLNQAFS